MGRVLTEKDVEPAVKGDIVQTIPMPTGEVGGVVRAAELAPQPAGEPAVVVVVERFDGMGGRQGYYSGRMIDALENKNCSHCRGGRGCPAIRCFCV